MFKNDLAKIFRSSNWIDFDLTPIDVLAPQRTPVSTRNAVQLQASVIRSAQASKFDFKLLLAYGASGYGVGGKTTESVRWPVASH